MKGRVVIDFFEFSFVTFDPPKEYLHLFSRGGCPGRKARFVAPTPQSKCGSLALAGPVFRVTLPALFRYA